MRHRYWADETYRQVWPEQAMVAFWPSRLLQRARFVSLCVVGIDRIGAWWQNVDSRGAI
jgi:hypothetical protein